MLSFFSNGGSFPSSFAGGVSFQAHGAHPLSKLCWRIVKADELNEIIMGWCGVTFWVGLLFDFFYLSEGSICYSSATYQQNHLNQRIFFLTFERISTHGSQAYPRNHTHQPGTTASDWSEVEGTSLTKAPRKIEGTKRSKVVAKCLQQGYFELHLRNLT